MSTVRDEIAKSLLFYRKKCGLTQKELAEKLGVKNTAVSNWESGNNSIDIETLFLACEIFGVTLNDMYGKYSVTTEKPVTTEDGNGIDSELLKRLMSLTPDEAAKVDAFVQGLLASRSGKTSLPETKRQ